MSSYHVDLIFNDGGGDHILPLIQGISDPQEGIKAVVHEGNRGDGSIVINSLMSSFRTNISTLPATLTLKHFDGTWITDWTYLVRRIGEIKFDDTSMRTNDIEYTITFLVLSY
jgi:hypothetical protein